ncbi:hypothetical protein [Streptomyces sp. NPDC058701]|uniref:hypothetical protein n=1 Tax=Streptomyces sp. NPDC058701 TaxID=3346608 RepID=UPI00365766C0
MAQHESVVLPDTCCEQGEQRAWIPSWLRSGITVFDTEINRTGEVMAVAWPGCDLRQAWRAWLRPLGGGREWNPSVDRLVRHLVPQDA